MSSMTTIKKELNSLSLSDVYSLMLFILFKLEDIPEYAVVSELSYLLDSRSLTRLFTYFAGKTITIPTKEEFQAVTNALLMYQKINIDGKSYVDAQNELVGLTKKQKEIVSDIYLKLIPIVNNYNINRAGVKKDAR